MASGIFALLDDIALMADDVATTTKVAIKKTAGILGDDIAVSSEKSTGFEQRRELKIIWAITKGSLKNKLIILPLVFPISIFASFLIPYILVAGAFYLLYEGVEKIEEYIYLKFGGIHDIGKQKILESTADTILDIEKKKIKSAIFTDFILSVEIIIIALSAVLNQSLMIQILATSIVAIVATFGVYGLVAAIVRIDNAGFWLLSKEYIRAGEFLISLMPKIIKFLSVLGTIAMLLVGGELLLHNIDYLHHTFDGGILSALTVGLIGGILALIVVKTIIKIKERNEK